MKENPKTILTPLYRESDPIYGDNGSVNFPFALVKKAGQTEKARLLWNPRTQRQTWIQNAVFSFHWHVLSPTEFQIFLIVPDAYIETHRGFFGIGNSSKKHRGVYPCQNLHIRGASLLSVSLKP